MPCLKFCVPLQHAGKNTTVRRGAKWFGCDGNIIEVETQIANALGHHTEPRLARVIYTALYRLCDLPPWVFVEEHDPACHTERGMEDAMRRAYPRIESQEIVTVVEYEFV